MNGRRVAWRHLRVGVAVWAAAAAAIAAGREVELNSASLAELEAIGGVGTALAARMIEQRERRPFTDWDDVRRRLKGVGPKVAARLSGEGLTVNGAPFTAQAAGATAASSPR